MVQKRHPHICRWIVGTLRHEPLPSVYAVLACAREVRVAGLDAPPWHELTLEVQVDVDSESEPNQPRRGWQKKAAAAVDNKFFSEEFWPALSGQERALVRSQTVEGIDSYSRTIYNTKMATDGYDIAYTFTHNNITLEHNAMNNKNTIAHMDVHNTQY